MYRACTWVPQRTHKLNESIDSPAETRTAPFLDLCVLLEGECTGLSIALAVRIVYRNKCRGTHLGEGRCAHADTHLARIHAYDHARCDEGAHVCDRPFQLFSTLTRFMYRRRRNTRPRPLGELGIVVVSHGVSTCASRLTRTLAFLRRPAQAD